MDQFKLVVKGWAFGNAAMIRDRIARAEPLAKTPEHHKTLDAMRRALQQQEAKEAPTP